MSDNKAIVDAIRLISGTKNDNKVQLYEGTVDEIILEAETRTINGVDGVNLNPDTCIITLLNGSNVNKLYNVQLSSGVCDGNIVEPVIGSLVYIMSSVYCQPFIVQYSDISRYNMIGDEFGGLVKVIELTDALNNLENKVNDILSVLDTLKTDYNTHIHTSATPGSPTTPVTVQTMIQIGADLTLSSRDDYENKSINHGKGEF